MAVVENKQGLSLELLQSRLKRVLWFHGSASPHWHGAAELLLRKTTSILLPDWFSPFAFKLFAKPICGRGIMFEWPLKAAICCSLLLTGNYWRDTTLADRIDVKTRDYLEARNSKWYYYYYILEVSPSLRSYFWGLVQTANTSVGVEISSDASPGQGSKHVENISEAINHSNNATKPLLQLRSTK